MILSAGDIFLLPMLVLCYACQIELTCEHSIKKFPDYSCVLPKDHGFFSESDEKGSLYSIQHIKTKVYYLLRVKPTQSKQDDHNPHIYFLKQAQSDPQALNYIESRIYDDYTYLITEKPTYGRLMDFMATSDYFNNVHNVLYFLKNLLLGVSYLHYKGIVNANLSYKSIYIRDDYKTAIGDFDKAKVYNTLYIRNPYYDYDDPYLNRPPYDKVIHFDEKIDIWSIGMVLYYLIHRKNLKIETKSPLELPNSSFNSVIVDRGVDTDLIEILNACLKIRPSIRATMLDLHNMVYNSLKKVKRSYSMGVFYLNLDYPWSQAPMSMLEKFSELIFVLFLVLLVIPCSVTLVTRRMKSDEEREARNAAAQLDQNIGFNI